MVKRGISLFLLSFLFFILSSNVYAYTNEKVIDNADLFTTEEEQKLAEKIDEIENKYSVTSFIITINENMLNENLSTRDYVELFGEQNIGNEYIGFAINIDSREYVIDVYGNEMLDIFDDNAQIEIEDNILPDMSAGNYYLSADKFLNSVKDIVKPNYFLPIGISAIAAIVISGLITILKILKHKEKKTAKTATNYISKNNSFINLKEDRFVRTYTTKTAKAEHNSNNSTTTHSSRSGHSHSGRSGKF